MALKDGEEIGISTGRMNSYYYRSMISLCSIDVEYGDLNTEVTVLWGDEGTRQKEALIYSIENSSTALTRATLISVKLISVALADFGKGNPLSQA